MTAAPQPRWNDRKIHWDPTKPRWIQIVKIAVQMGAFFGGIVLSLVSMFLYPMFLTGLGFLLVYVGGTLLGGALTFLAIRPSWFPSDMPLAARLQVRLGIGMCAAFACSGLFGIVNGYHTPVVVQDYPMAFRRTTAAQPRDSQTGYYVGARVWPGSHDVYEIDVPRSLYMSLDDAPERTHRVWRQELDALPDRGSLRLAVGHGRLGVNWLDHVIGAGARSK